MNSARKILLAAALMTGVSALPARAALLDDNFTTGDIATSAGPGGGFGLGGGAGNTAAFESGGAAVVGSGAVVAMTTLGVAVTANAGNAERAALLAAPQVVIASATTTTSTGQIASPVKKATPFWGQPREP